MPAELASFAQETLRLREETQRLIDLSRTERRMCDALVAQSMAIFPRLLPWNDDGTDQLPQHGGS